MPAIAGSLQRPSSAVALKHKGVCATNRIIGVRQIMPGDVLVVFGGSQFASIGQNGGFMGHVLLAIGQLEKITRESREGKSLINVWPQDAPQIWKVKTIECSRGNDTLYVSDFLLHQDARNQAIALIGESPPGESQLQRIKDSFVEIWQSPCELRSHLQVNVMSQVIAEMMNYDCRWSLITAARAVFMSAQLANMGDKHNLLDEVASCWESPFICTSVVIGFWQRYLCKVAETSGQCKGSMILKYMPLRADSGLPGDLIAKFRQCAWVNARCLH